MAESVALALKHRYNGRSYAHQLNSDSAIRSMELMRFNIQECFDKEIDAIVRKYIDVCLGGQMKYNQILNIAYFYFPELL